jgi:hypothetical protein
MVDSGLIYLNRILIENSINTVRFFLSNSCPAYQSSFGKVEDLPVQMELEKCTQAPGTNVVVVGALECHMLENVCNVLVV